MQRLDRKQSLKRSASHASRDSNLQYMTDSDGRPDFVPATNPKKGVVDTTKGILFIPILHARHSLKRKKSTNSGGTSSAVTAPTTPEEMDLDVDAYLRPGPSTGAFHPYIQENDPGRYLNPTLNDHHPSQPNPRSKRDKGKGPEQSHSRHSHPARRSFTEEDHKEKLVDASERDSFFGPLARAEFERMKREIDLLKKTLHETKKTMKKQSKTQKLEDLKVQEVAVKQEHEEEIDKWKSQCKKKDELIASVELSMQCHICMDMLCVPYAVVPCGHVYCLGCLQSWFCRAPFSPNDVGRGIGRLDILRRSKSCPSCRASVHSRPIPVFMVKAVTSALIKAKAAPDSEPDVALPEVAEDPWKGIFPEDSDDDEDDDDDDDDDEYEDEEDFGMANPWFTPNLAPPFGFGSSSSSDTDEEDDDDDDDDDESVESYVRPQWEPPSVPVDLESGLFDHYDEQTVRMLRRGCTAAMIERFEMEYRHRDGLIAYVDAQLQQPQQETRVSRVFLGWNISFDRQADPTGEHFINDALAEIREFPERWLVLDRVGVPGCSDARKLVHDVDVYATTDTEVWLDAEDDDDDD